MIYNFNFKIEKDGQPYLTSDKASKFLSDMLYSRVSDRPVLEAKIAKDLIETDEVNLVQEDAQHLLNVILSTNYDNYFKVELAKPLLVDEIDGVPTQISLWQLRASMESKLLTDYHPIPMVEAIGTAIGLTSEQATSYNLLQYVSQLISLMPSSTPEERIAKSRAFQAFEYANTIFRSSSTVSSIGGILQLSKQDIDNLYIIAKQVEA